MALKYADSNRPKRPTSGGSCRARSFVLFVLFVLFDLLRNGLPMDPRGVRERVAGGWSEVPKQSGGTCAYPRTTATQMHPGGVLETRALSSSHVPQALEGVFTHPSTLFHPTVTHIELISKMKTKSSKSSGPGPALHRASQTFEAEFGFSTTIPAFPTQASVRPRANHEFQMYTFEPLFSGSKFATIVQGS